MTCANDGKRYNGKQKKSELLPRGDQAKEITEVLVAMYQSMHSPETTANDVASEDAK